MAERRAELPPPKLRPGDLVKFNVPAPWGRRYSGVGIISTAIYWDPTIRFFEIEGVARNPYLDDEPNQPMRVQVVAREGEVSPLILSTS